jgi:hypothetical protein
VLKTASTWKNRKLPLAELHSSVNGYCMVLSLLTKAWVLVKGQGKRCTCETHTIIFLIIDFERTVKWDRNKEAYIDVIFMYL